MKKITLLAPLAVLALSACGSSTDASQDATADTVEIPADNAMASAPDPVADAGANVDAPAPAETGEVAEDAPTTVEDTADAAAAAAADAEAALGAVDAAEVAE